MYDRCINLHIVHIKTNFVIIFVIFCFIGIISTNGCGVKSELHVLHKGQ